MLNTCILNKITLHFQMIWGPKHTSIHRHAQNRTRDLWYRVRCVTLRPPKQLNVSSVVNLFNCLKVLVHKWIIYNDFGSFSDLIE